MLFDKLTNSQSDDIKFLSFKIYTDILTQYIADEQVYNPASGGVGEGASKGGEQQFVGGPSSEAIGNAILQSVLPKSMHILTECQDPIPMFGLRLLSSIIDSNPKLIKQIKKLSSMTPDRSTSFSQLLASFYQLNHPRLNRHTIQIMKSLINHRELTLPDLQQLSILPKTQELLTSMLQNKQEWCLELTMDILHDLLTWFNEIVKGNESAIAYHIEEVFNNFEVCVQLLSQQSGGIGNVSLIEKASQCLIQMLQLYAQSQLKKRDIYFVESHFDHLIEALALKSSSERQIIQKRVLKCIYWALIQDEYQI